LGTAEKDSRKVAGSRNEAGNLVALRIDIQGPGALLVRFADKTDASIFARCQTLVRHFAAHPPTGLIEATPGLSTLLLEFDTGCRPDPKVFSPFLEGILHAARRESAPAGRRVEVPVIYDGPDLERAAAQARLTIPQWIDLHARGTYVVRLMGLAPDFVQLTGLPPKLSTTRPPGSSQAIPPGTVAIQGEHTAIFFSVYTGQWNLIGRTSMGLLDADRAALGTEETFRLRPTEVVRFVATPAGS
jgi:KipI family sensor histidine kinase inhibitor